MRVVHAFLLSAALSAATASAQIVETSVPGDPVALDSGLVSGKVLASGVHAYLGVPFAEPPVRELRWREPKPVRPWKGVYHADRKPSMCMQQMRGHNLNHYFGEEAASEDCLYLNLWVPPEAKPGDRRPVLVFIYGGGYTQGTANLANYSGENLAKKGVLYVAMNYRVGALGFMAHPELSAETGRGTSGNWGLLDQIAALQWIRRNIAKFGGDPGNVTIMGQSAGSASVSYLQSSPLARGLMHRVFGMSASAVVYSGAGRTSTLADAEQAGLQLQAALEARSLAEMRLLPADVIYAAQRAPGAPRFQPVVDNYLLPAMPNEIFAAGRQNDVPAMLGYMRDESSNILRRAKTVEEYRAAARQLFGDAADEFLKLYPVASDADVAAAGAKAAREAGMESTMRAWARAHVKTGKAPIWINMFSRVHPYAPGVTFSDHDPKTAGAYHTGEVPYWFQTQDAYNMFRTTRNWTEYDRQLSDKLSDALIAFARTGNPNTPAISWPRYDPSNEQVIEFGDSIRVLRMNTAGLDFFAAHPLPAAGPPR
ncbi:MAG: carboxylesterase/lipase family protein [Vicinamibacterales bacterium]